MDWAEDLIRVYHNLAELLIKTGDDIPYSISNFEEIKESYEENKEDLEAQIVNTRREVENEITSKIGERFRNL